MKIIVAIMVGFLAHMVVAAENCDYKVIKVSKKDSLTVRLGPGVKYKKVGVIPYNSLKVKITGPVTQIGDTLWTPVEHDGTVKQILKN